jgi:biopolymer transport protein TolQ
MGDSASVLALVGAEAMTVDIVQAVSDSDIVGIVCLLACFGLSVASWVVIFYKIKVVRNAASQSDRFDHVLDTAGSLEEVFRRTPEFPQSPIAQILREAILEMEAENWYADDFYEMEERLTAARLGVERVMERTISNEASRLESHLVFLATTASVAPFVGLFGTVWGVLAAFQALGMMGNASASTLAPGISTALVTTVAGLVAAIPASIFYNYLSNKIGIMTSRMDSFALELANIIQKRMVKQVATER